MADERQPRKPKIVLGAELKDDRAIQRRHIGYESPAPPREPTITEWPPETKTDPRWPRLDRPPPSSGGDSLQLKIPGKLVIAMVGAIITAALGGSAVTKLQEKPAAPPEEVVRVEKRTENANAKQNGYLRGSYSDEVIRNTAELAYLCYLNKGVSPFRNVDCPELECVQQPLIRNGKIIPRQFVCMFDIDWPAPRLPP